MKTLRSSFRPAASPGCGPTTSTGIPSGPKVPAKRSAPSPDASAGVRRPVLGNDADERNVHELHRERRGELELEIRSGGVQIGVESVDGERVGDADCGVERDCGRVDAENDVGTPDRFLAARSILDSVEIPGRVPAAHHAACRREIGGDPAARLAEAEHRDLHQPSTISRSPLRSYDSSPVA